MPGRLTELRAAARRFRGSISREESPPMANFRNSRFALLVLVLGAGLNLTSCFGNSNAAIGKWSLAPQGGDGCPDSMEFTATSMTASTAGIAASHDISYTSNGANVTVSSPDGFTTTLTASGNNLSVLQPIQCTYTRAQ